MNANIISKKFPPKKLKSYKLKASRGFTLIEMLVSISVFMVVMLVAASSLLSIIDGNNKAQSLKSAINNLNFTLESMQKNIRVGTDYHCGYGSSSPECQNGDTVMSFRSYKDLNVDGTINDYVTYRINNNSIERCISVNASCQSNGAFTSLTAQEVQITSMTFYVNSSPQPRVLLTISGKAGSKEKIKTTFNLQTTVSQRAF